jgi:hypothetical protein
MITRRGFFVMLAALPLIGRLLPKASPPFVEDRQSGIRIRFVKDWECLSSSASINGCTFTKDHRTGSMTEVHGLHCQCAPGYTPWLNVRYSPPSARVLEG